MGIVLALQVHRYLHARRSASTMAPRPDVRAGKATSRPARNPAQLLKDPLAQARLCPMSKDPAGIVPPAGAKRLWAFSRTRGRFTDLSARYELPGQVPAAAHYRHLVASKGFHVLSDRSDRDGWRSLVAMKAHDRAIVRLRTDPAKPTMVQITVTVMQE